MQLDIAANHAPPSLPPDARGPPIWPASCVSYIENPDLISSKFAGHGGARPNSGGARENSGGARAGAGRPFKSPERAIMPDDVTRWYCIRAAFGREKEADIAVRIDGFTVFNPSIYRKAVDPRRDSAGIMRPGKPAQALPLLGRYFFVELNLSDPYWYQVKRLPGVDCVMSGADLDAGGSPSPIAIPDRALVHIRTLLELNDCHYPDGMPHEKRPVIAVGTALVLNDGPMTGRTGICEESDGLQVRLSMIVMGHLVPVEVAQSWCDVVK
jgi:transcription antitermination factor NusG